MPSASPGAQGDPVHEPDAAGGRLLARSLWAAPAQIRFRGENISGWRYAPPRPELPG
jgi:hypothetical protein